MKIHTVTLTGVDSSVKSSDLIKISRKYDDLVEWGILYGTKQNSPRYPSIGRILELDDSLTYHPRAIHFCGDQAAKYYYGECEIKRFCEYHSTRRIQLNLPAYITENLNADMVGNNNIIFQYNEFTKTNLEKHFWQNRFNSNHVLFDFSGGTGKRNRFEKMDSCFDSVGYAGGIGPDTIENDLKELETVTERNSIWIDMESSLRTIVGGKDIFDLDKCEAVLDKVLAFNENC